MTSVTILAVLAIFSCISATKALRCDSCVSYKSLADCASRAKDQSCSGKSNRCISIYYKTATTKVWKKGCAEESLCTRKHSCPLTYTQCTVECCSSSHCNSGFVAKSLAAWILVTVAIFVTWLCAM